MFTQTRRSQYLACYTSITFYNKFSKNSSDIKRESSRIRNSYTFPETLEIYIPMLQDFYFRILYSSPWSLSDVAIRVVSQC